MNGDDTESGRGRSARDDAPPGRDAPEEDPPPDQGQDGQRSGSEDAPTIDLDGLSFTPEQHQRLKQLLHEDLTEIAYSDRRYLVAGAASEEAAERRFLVCELLDERPDATAFRLEDFGFTRDDLPLWAAAFEILCEQASYVVGVVEDFDGGYVWELGLAFYREIRLKLWILKRVYDDATLQREQYDNGMAASHMAALMQTGRVLEWSDEADLRETVAEIP